MEERTYCVYQIYNKVKNMSYIGSTCHFETRIKQHKKDNTGWHIDFNQHPENYEVHVLEDNIPDTNIKERELYFIDLYDAISNGYNKNHAGNHTNLEIREKLSKSISKANKGENNPMYGKEPWNKGKTGIYSEETLQKKSKSMKKYLANKQKETRIWINNGINTKQIKPDELQKYIALGYQRGRKPKE